jgi:hypothetical protein
MCIWYVGGGVFEGPVLAFLPGGRPWPCNWCIWIVPGTIGCADPDVGRRA